MAYLLGWLVGLLAFRLALGAECHGKPSPDAKPNLNPIASDPPKFVNSTRNGKLLTVGDGNGLIYLVHVWGTPYDMGYAHGSLLKERTQDMLNSVWSYFELQVEQAINGTIDFLPPWFLKDVADVGLDAALDLEILATEDFTGDYFLQEIRGLADASGVDYKKIQRIHMIGELTKGACSMFGANSSATPDGSLLQLRALDWDVEGPFKNFPQITVYHPQPNNGYPFVNIGWTGWIGSITGISSEKIAISEIGVSFPDDSFGKESRFGVPFTYLLRDILQFDNSLEKAMQRISSAHRTCDLILGVGDGEENAFRGVEYSASVADFFTWDDLRPEATWHPRITDIVYWGMDWLCPAYSEVLAKQLTTYHGNITAVNTIRDIVSIVQTGDLHVAIYDLGHDFLYVANARADGEAGPTYAYDRTFLQLNMSALFAEQPPPSF